MTRRLTQLGGDALHSRSLAHRPSAAYCSKHVHSPRSSAARPLPQGATAIDSMLRSSRPGGLIWILQWLPGIVSGAGTVSIGGMNGFGQARSCVAEAFHLWGSGGLWNGALQCSNDNGGYQDSCVCRCDLRTLGESYISSYVKSACSSNNFDIQSGLLLYDAYCASALPASCPGYTPVPVQVTLPTKAPGTVSIWAMDGFASARSCMTEAFHAWAWGGLWNGPLLCSNNNGYLNECVCRADLLSLGESYISSFVKSACSSDTTDILSGLSMYDNYCATAYPIADQITSVETGVIQLGTATSVLFTPTETGSSSASNFARTTEGLTSSTDGFPTPTNGSGGSGQSQGLSRSDVIALGVGLGVGLPATIAALVTCWYTIKEPRHDRPPAYSHHGAR